MTPETARLLAQVIKTRDEAAEGLKRLLATPPADAEGAWAIERTMVALAVTYVHEQRIINRIIHEAVDE